MEDAEGHARGATEKKLLCKGPCVTGLPCLNRAKKEGYCTLHYKLYVEQNQNSKRVLPTG